MAAQSNEIDTNPSFPKPPQKLIDAAARQVPEVLGDIRPQHDGTVAIAAARLAKHLQDCGHTLAAANWAVHQLVQEGMFKPTTITVELPSVGTWRGGGFGHLCGGPQTAHVEWSGGGTRTIPIVATDELWKWWHQTAETRATRDAGLTDVIERGLRKAPSRTDVGGTKRYTTLPNTPRSSTALGPIVARRWPLSGHQGEETNEER